MLILSQASLFSFHGPLGESLKAVRKERKEVKLWVNKQCSGRVDSFGQSADLKHFGIHSPPRCTPLSWSTLPP